MTAADTKNTRKTRDQQLLDSRQECDSLKTLLQRANESASTARQEMAAAKEAEVMIRKKFDDLKSRLFESQQECSRMRGYVERVQEDDVVREDLIKTGDPEGEVRIVPKRKLTPFPAPQQETDFAIHHDGGYGYASRQKTDRKHWITY